ncbi:MAG: metalloregulator ArsR/SmtB family transcription factor [Candidatus Latescibacteria bacterium]|nr:metalloregulator ArsR/SmtB family transcription factor [Candidatus Latescibacterota bacterium]NIM64479.1 metalloregulator ArsR/SmtB family transcription factor [Candidatus Latescibacterota bacterium]NIO00632.1 metalloregulator ArsR/SmtB family transcription factor [Candidatus Latescibacterota bacterium]NIO27034.1 metalloregulator ArsR/SmtB family transcription factor [Candidatus Latescibacterota bacterium]NIO54559.1 metalloregulator ArsR/SmtB family transcription factor [Candidatus Latesciba
MSEHTQEQFFKAARLLKSLAHPLRLAIACGLRNQPCTQTYMADVLEIPQSTVAQHLKVLRSEGIVKCERRGLEVIFSLADPCVPMILDTLCRREDRGEGSGYSWDELAWLEKERRVSGLW